MSVYVLTIGSGPINGQFLEIFKTFESAATLRDRMIAGGTAKRGECWIEMKAVKE